MEIKILLITKDCFMNDILTILFYPLPNAITSGFMAVILLYWIISFMGVSFDDIGVDFDTHVDADVDIDAGVDTHMDTDSSLDTHADGGIFMGMLKFMNVGKAPFMIILTSLFFFTWAGSLVVTQFIPMTNWGLLSVLILIPLLIMSSIFTKIITAPLASFLNKTGYNGEKEIAFYGEGGKMLSTIQDDKIGVAEFIIESNPIKLYVVSVNGEKLQYGDSVIITERKKDKKTYFVAKNF